MTPKGRGFVTLLLRYSWLPWVLALVLATGLVTVAYYVFLNWDPDGYWRAIGGALIEFGLIVILGAGFNQVLQASRRRSHRSRGGSRQAPRVLAQTSARARRGGAFTESDEDS
jgi:hypothetical protein